VATTLNIAALSRRTGVAPDTLRKWEQRYGILNPERTAGGQRRYSERDIARVEWLRDRLREGYRISEAASILGGADAEPATDPAELSDLLLKALSANDPVCVSSLIDQAFALVSLDRAIVEIVAPVLERVGEGWANGSVSVAQEHLLTAKLRARLEQLVANERGGVRGTAVLACAPGEQHDVGLLMLAVLLGADGWHVEFLGADMPVVQTMTLALALDADLVCISTAGAESAARLRAELAGAMRPEGVDVVVGGRAASPELAAATAARHLDEDLLGAVRALRSSAR
jgi:DNA-binding transcriptional MerR regulator